MSIFFNVRLKTVLTGQQSGLNGCIYISDLIEEHALKGLLTALWLKSQRNLGACNLNVLWMKLEEVLQQLNWHTPNTNEHSEIHAAKTLSLGTHHSQHSLLLNMLF